MQRLKEAYKEHIQHEEMTEKLFKRAIKRKVDSERSRGIRNLEEYEKEKEAKRKEFYESRVSMNQSMVAQRQEKILQAIQRETELLEKLKDTRNTSEKIGRKLSEVILKSFQAPKDRLSEEARSSLLSNDQKSKKLFADSTFVK